MKGAGIIIRKELKRVFSDRKLVFSLFILPAILMIGIYSLMGNLIKSMESDITEHISEVYIVNADDGFKQTAKNFKYEEGANVHYLTESEYASQKADLEEKILNADIELIAVFDKGFESTVSAYTKAGDAIPQVNVYYNSAENYSTQAYSVFSGLLSDYRTNLLAGRLGNLEQLNVFTQNDQLIVKEAKANNRFISMMLPYLITMLLFAGAMSVGVDAIAGEKERGTLASMLLSPVSRDAIVVGKLVSMAILSSLSAIVYAVSMIVAMSVMGSTMGDLAANGFGNVSFGPTQCLMLLAIMLVMVYLYVAIIGLLAVLAKDVKTASTYISPVYIVVIIAGMLTMFNSGKAIPTTRYAIPIYGNALAIADLCSNELTSVNFLASIGGTLLLAIIITVAVGRAFNSEKIMFNA